MLTYKGSKLFKGKHFINESNTRLTYKGKIYGDKYLFESDDNIELILNENEIENLKDYKVLKEHSLLEEQDNHDDLYQLVASYTDDQLKLFDGPSNKLWSSLKDSMQEELNKLSDLGLAYKISYQEVDNLDQGYLQELIMDYLKDIQRNISATSLPNHYIQLSNFIYEIDKLRGED